MNDETLKIGTSYFEVYRRAIVEFKDPTLKKMLDNSTIMFGETMYNFMTNAIPLFTSPREAKRRINDRMKPNLMVEEFYCDGEQNTFLLQAYPDDELVSECLFEYLVNGEKVDGAYNAITHTVTLATIPDMDSTFESNIYYIGNFTEELYEEEIYILSQFIVACWSEFIANDKLDIIRLLGDTDFKLTSNASTTTAKTAWGVTTIERASKRMSKYAWDCRYNKVCNDG